MFGTVLLWIVGLILLIAGVVSGVMALAAGMMSPTGRFPWSDLGYLVIAAPVLFLLGLLVIAAAIWG